MKYKTNLESIANKVLVASSIMNFSRVCHNLVLSPTFIGSSLNSTPMYGQEKNFVRVCHKLLFCRPMISIIMIFMTINFIHLN